MILRTVRSVSVWVLVAAMCATAAADGPKTVKPTFRPRWKAGDVATWTSKERMSRTTTEEHVGGLPIVEKTEYGTEFVAIVRCDEGDADGYMTRGLIWFQRWSDAEGENMTEELTGLHVELTGTGKSRAIKVVTPGAELTPDVQGWLEDSFGKENSREPLEVLLEPAEPVSVGGTWTPDLEKLARLLQKKFAIDTSKSSATLKLISLDGDVAHCSLDMRFPLTSVTVPQGKFAAGAESVLTLAGESTSGIGAELSDSKRVKETLLRCSFEMEKGTTLKLEAVKKLEVTQTKGGEMPPIKAADVPK